MRGSVVAHLTDAVFFLLTAVTLYLLLKHAGKHAGRLMVVAVIIAAGIISVSAVFAYVALQVATDGSYVTAFGLSGSNALVLLLLDIQHYAVLAAQVFFGLWLAPLGYLAIKSKLFPKAVGIILILATVSYLTDVVLAFPAPRTRSADSHLFGHRARHRRDLDGFLPAHHRRSHSAHAGPNANASGTSLRPMMGCRDCQSRKTIVARAG
jgi:hypothetical protein